MRLLLDMNLPPRWRSMLEAHGHTCTHWSDVGDPRATDADVMQWARSRGYVVLTHDLDFGAVLAATHAGGPSVVQIRTQDVLSPKTESLLVEVLRKHETDLEAGALLVVDEARLRVRLLPLGGAMEHPGQEG